MIQEEAAILPRIEGEIGGENWTEVIGPKRHLFRLNLGEVWRYRDLIILFVKRDLASQYRQTVLGTLWFLIQPVMTMLMFLIVFNKIAKIPTDGLPPSLFYLSSITIWNYFSSCLTSTSNTFVSNAGIFGKVYFPRLVSPLSAIISNLIKFLIQLSLVAILIACYYFNGFFSPQTGWHVLLLPVIVFFTALMGLGIGIICSSLTTKYRDLSILIGFAVGLLMYVTPVAYPLSYLQESGYAAFIRWNPLTPMVEGFRYAIFGEGVFDPLFFLYSIGCTMVFLLVGVLLFNKVERSFMDTV